MTDASTLDRTHDPEARSWVDAAHDGATDFPLQNLPFAVFRRSGSSEPFRGGVAIGDRIVDLAAVAAIGALPADVSQSVAACAEPRLNAFFALGPPAWRALRHALFDALDRRAEPSVRSAIDRCLVPQAEANYAIPLSIGDYTDFYTSIDHALNIGRQVRPDDPLSPNFRWMPIAYHGRVSSIDISGQQVMRPRGQYLPPGASEPVFGPSQRLDFELELGIWIGSGNAQGDSIGMADAERHVFGMCLLNDWSARDIQRWETVPLGPFQSKNFATTISPWIVTMDALAPFRKPPSRPPADPKPLPHLDSVFNRAQGALDIELEVLLQSASMRSKGIDASRLSRTNFRHQYWTVAQMVAHHTAGGCNLGPGDLFGSGTISGPGPGEAGAMIELTVGGTRPVALAGGEERGFLQDEDRVTLRAWCEAPGRARIGFGTSVGTVLPVKSI